MFFVGHEPGRPLFGSRFCGERENLLVSWGVDGRLCLWDSYLLGNVNSPLAILKYDSEYPIYAVELSQNYVAIGGGSEGGFVGVPLYLYSFQLPMSGGDDQQRTESNSSNGFEVTKDDDPAIGSENVNATDQNLESDSKATDSKIENNPPPDKKLMADDTEESTKNHVVDTERVK